MFIENMTCPTCEGTSPKSKIPVCITCGAKGYLIPVQHQVWCEECHTHVSAVHFVMDETE